MSKAKLYGRHPKAGEPACPHTVQQITSKKHVPSTAGTVFPSCMGPWFSLDTETNVKRFPLLFPCGHHAMCPTCFQDWRKETLQSVHFPSSRAPVETVGNGKLST
jgi:hypothetical protein